MAIPDCDPEIMKELYTSKFSCEKALQSLQTKRQWIDSKFPYSVGPSMFELLTSGVFELVGRDKCYRPILLINLGMLDELAEKPTVETMITTVMIYQEYLIKFMLIPGKIENVISIMNAGGQGPLNLPLSLIKPMARTLLLNYKCRTRTQFVVNASYGFNLFFQTFKVIMDYNTAQKI